MHDSCQERYQTIYLLNVLKSQRSNRSRSFADPLYHSIYNSLCSCSESWQVHARWWASLSQPVYQHVWENSNQLFSLSFWSARLNLSTLTLHCTITHSHGHTISTCLRVFSTSCFVCVCMCDRERERMSTDFGKHFKITTACHLI